MSRLLKMALVAGALTISPLALSAASAENLKVVASFSILGDLARNVGGDRITLTTLVGPNGDAHVYEPRPADAAAVASADVVLVNGLQLEGFLQRLVEASATKAPIVELTKGIEPLKSVEEDGHQHEAAAEDGHAHEHEEKAEAGHSHDHEAEEEHVHEAGENHAEEEGHRHHHGAFDPHAWQSVPNAEIYVKNIADAFCAADAAGCDTYKANAQAYTATLKALDGEIREAVDGIPQDKRTIITSHDAFNYFEHAYGIKFLAPEGVSTESEASAADVAALIRQIREDKASAIFVENITNPRLVEQIAGETGLNVGGELYSDALSEPEGGASTYVDMMRHNIETIRGAILGS